MTDFFMKKIFYACNLWDFNSIEHHFTPPIGHQVALGFKPLNRTVPPG